MLQGARARGGGIRTPGAGCGFGPRVRGGDSGPSAGWDGDSSPGAEWGLFGVRWEIFYLFAVFLPFG